MVNHPWLSSINCWIYLKEKMGCPFYFNFRKLKTNLNMHGCLCYKKLQINNNTPTPSLITIPYLSKECNFFLWSLYLNLSNVVLAHTGKWVVSLSHLKLTYCLQLMKPRKLEEIHLSA